MAIDFLSEYLGLGTNNLVTLCEGGATGMMWANPHSYLISYPRLVDAYQSNGWFSGLDQGREAWWFEHYTTGANAWWATLNNTVILNQWTHFAWTWDSDFLTTPSELYLNGESVASQVISAPTGTLGTNIYQPTVAANHGGGSDYDGELEDIRLYKRILSPSEIQDIYHNRGRDGNVNNLLRRSVGEVNPSGYLMLAGVDLSPNKEAYTVNDGNPIASSGLLTPKY